MAELTAAKNKREGYLTAVTTRIRKLEQCMMAKQPNLRQIQSARDCLRHAWKAYEGSQLDVLLVIDKGEAEAESMRFGEHEASLEEVIDAAAAVLQ